MSYAMFGWNNRVVTGAVSVTTAVAGLDGSQLQNAQGSSSTAWQTSDPAGAYGAVYVDAGQDVTWRAFGLFRTNLTAAATVRWYVSDSSGHIPFDTGYPDGNAGVSTGFGQSVVTSPTDVTGRYLTVILHDLTNPDGFINVPLMFAGPAWMPQTNISYDTVLGRDDSTDEVTTRGGQEFPTTQFVRRRWDVAFSGIRETELWPQAMALDAYARTNGNALFIPDSAGDVARETVFGRAKSTADVSFPNGSADRRAWKMRFSERL